MPIHYQIYNTIIHSHLVLGAEQTTARTSIPTTLAQYGIFQGSTDTSKTSSSGTSCVLDCLKMD